MLLATYTCMYSNCSCSGILLNRLRKTTEPSRSTKFRHTSLCKNDNFFQYCQGSFFKWPPSRNVSWRQHRKRSWIGIEQTLLASMVLKRGVQWSSFPWLRGRLTKMRTAIEADSENKQISQANIKTTLQQRILCNSLKFSRFRNNFSKMIQQPDLHTQNFSFCLIKRFI